MYTPWLKDYAVRNWIVMSMHTGAFAQELRPLLNECYNLRRMVAESEEMLNLWGRGGFSSWSIPREIPSHDYMSYAPYLFFTDVEQILGMGRDRVSGGTLFYLTDEFLGHPKGTLVYFIPDNINRGYFTVAFAT